MGNIALVSTSAYATGTLTLAVQPTVGDTITLDQLTYTYTENFGVPDEITIGVDLAETQVNTINPLNAGQGATPPTIGARAFVANMSTLYAAVPGTAGNGLAVSSSFADAANHFDQAALTGGTDGSESGHIQAQTATLSGASPSSPVLRIRSSPGQYGTEDANIFEIIDADGNEYIKIDGGGNFYTKRDLRMDDPDNVSNFTIQSDGKVFFRIPDIDEAARWLVRGTVPGLNDATIFQLRPNTGRTVYIRAAAAGSVALEINTNGLDDSDLVNVYGNVNADLVFRILQAGAIVTAQHSAPDDADINTGDMAIWYDQTNGAAAMMIKAKTADGTVVTGSVPLA